MNEQILYDLVAKKKASLWSSIEDTIEELPEVIERLRGVNMIEDAEELLCIVVEKLGSAQTFLMESGLRISALEDIKTKVVDSLPDHQIKLADNAIEDLSSDKRAGLLNSDGTYR
jgi:hypothetical protein